MGSSSIWLFVAGLVLAYALVQAAPVSKAESEKKELTPNNKGTTAEEELKDLTNKQAPATSEAKPENKETVQKPEPAAADSQKPEKPEEKRGRAAAMFKQGMTDQQQPEEIKRPNVVSYDEGLAPEANLPWMSEPVVNMPQPPNDLESDLTPRKVAEYLILTGDFKGFDDAVADLLITNIMTPEEVEEYRDAVGYEYQTLLKTMVDAEDSYYQPSALSDEPALMEYQEPVSRRASAVPDYGNMMDMPGSDLDEAIKKLQLEAMLDKEATLDQLLEEIVKDYVMQAAEKEAINNEEPDLNEVLELLGERIPSQETEAAGLEVESPSGLVEEDMSSEELTPKHDDSEGASASSEDEESVEEELAEASKNKEKETEAKEAEEKKEEPAEDKKSS